MEKNEADSRRREILGRVIAEINNNTEVSMRHQTERDQRDSESKKKDNVFQLFGDNQQQSTSKKH